MKRKPHGLVGVRKSRSHRENLSKSARAFWARAHEALATLKQQASAGDANDSGK